ncbi:IS3 family transposase [Streptomyces sp. NPDC088124]|uniref:IS3 family transposase n=1 Tax=Streptomyces sp. NPDC088124 TaxID=3154654 RepID=UPI0034255B66
MPVIREVFATTYRVYGARKIWRELNRQGRQVARRTTDARTRQHRRYLRQTGHHHDPGRPGRPGPNLLDQKSPTRKVS